jgi:hypothetical protein
LILCSTAHSLVSRRAGPAAIVSAAVGAGACDVTARVASSGIDFDVFDLDFAEAGQILADHLAERRLPKRAAVARNPA